MIKKLFIILLILFSFVIGGFFWFLYQVPDEESGNLQQTDAIVVLTGGKERLKAGLALLINGYAAEMFISGVGEGAKVSELYADEQLSEERMKEAEQRISLGHTATDTYGNGFEVANWVLKKNYKSIRLVTSNYHLPRSLKEISRRIPDVEIVPFPVFSDNVKTKEWWKNPGTSWLLMEEYAKYIAVIFRVEFDN